MTKIDKNLLNNSQKYVQGVVVSNKMIKTIVVYVERKVKHSMYGKYITKSTKYYAHDEKEIANEGDIVKISEIRPISKLKRWNLSEVVLHAK